MEGLRSMLKNKNPPQNLTVSALQITINFCFKLPGRDTIPIQSAAKVPRLGTIGKNHIQSRFSFVAISAFLSALNLILPLRIVTHLLTQTQPFVEFETIN